MTNNVYSFDSCIFVGKDLFTLNMERRSIALDQALDILAPLLDERELEKFSNLAANIILNPYYRVKYKSQMPEKYKEYTFLSSQQLFNRRKAEILVDRWEED